MSVTLADLNSRVFEGLEAASEYLDLSTVHSTVIQRVNELTMQARASSINVLLGTSAEFTPDELNYDITSLIGKAIPAFLEVRQVGQQNQLDDWTPIRSIPLAQLSDYQELGGLAVAFHGSEPDDNTTQATQYASFTYLPGGVCRIRFDRDNERTALSAATLLPDNLSEYPVLLAQNTLISRIKFKIAMDLRRDKELREIAPMVIGSLDAIHQQNLIDIEPLKALYRIWAYRDRSSDTAFNNPTPDSSLMYPMGGNNNWVGNGWGGQG